MGRGLRVVTRNFSTPLQTRGTIVGQFREASWQCVCHEGGLQVWTSFALQGKKTTYTAFIQTRERRAIQLVGREVGLRD